MAAAMDGFGTEGLDFPTETSLEQWKLEHVARDIYRRSVASARIREEASVDDGAEEDPTEECVACEGGWEASVAVLHRETHVAYLTKSLRHLSAGHVVLDASRCWLCYWIVHALALLGEPLGEDTARDVVEFLSLCQHPDGGFGGGPGQMPHLAPTYAAVACLAEIATVEAVKCVNRAECVAFLARCKDKSTGGYRMHEGGETDTRGCYTALAVARLLGVGGSDLTEGLGEGVGSFVAMCQTHEGGVAGEPGAEAHGGYTYCGLAAAVLCDSAHSLDLPELAHWLAHRQGGVEGGFNGRTNKLVDGCYSFWQGGAFPVLEMASGAVLRAMGVAEGGAEGGAAGGAERRRRRRTGGNEGGEAIASDASSNAACALFPAAQLSNAGKGDWRNAVPSFSSRALQGWLLLCCQLPSGGMQDKPGKGRDHYHTCYCLSGLSVAQHWGSDGLVGPATNLLERTDPLVNVTEARLAEWTRLVAQLPKI